MLRFRRVTFDFSRCYVAGVLNVTPDSFSDGGRFTDESVAIHAGERLAAEGADVIDVGGESTRPGAAPVGADEEIARVVPVIRALVSRVAAPISIDTSKARVAAAALEAGAEIVNDVSGGRFDPAIIDVAARAQAAIVVGHVRGGTIADTHAAEAAPIAWPEIVKELTASIDALPPALRARSVADPGIGFGKRGAANVELIRRAGELAKIIGRPVMIGASRKRFLGDLTGRMVDDRDDASVGAALAAAASGASFVRVHDVKATRDALTVFETITRRAP